MDKSTARPELDAFEQQTRAFKRKAISTGSVVLVIAALAVIVVYWGNPFVMVGGAVVAIINLTTLWLSQHGRQELAGQILVIGSLAATAANTITSQNLVALDVYAQMLFLILATFIVSPRMVLLGVISVITVIGTNVTHFGDASFGEERLPMMLTSLLFLVILVALLYLFSRNAAENLEAHRRRLWHNAELFHRVPEAANRLSSAASEISAMSQQQLQGAVRQSSALGETRASLHALLRAMEAIVSSAKQSRQSASTTLENAERVAAHITRLAEHTTRITAILESIKELSNKSDLLALNAALEGVKAGEQGRGFSLVAGQMQQLAENISKAVADIKSLTTDIRRETSETARSTAETNSLAKTSTEMAQQISLVVEQQRETVAQIANAMDEVAEISDQVRSGHDETLSSTGELEHLAEQLSLIVEDFRTATITGVLGPGE